MAWRCGSHTFPVGERTLIVGIVNVTPDSFSDGGRFLDRDAAIAHGLRLLDEGADLLDVGGESTRPGARPTPADEEQRRVLPVIEALAARAPVSVDTRKPEVARAALQLGACVVNDVQALAAPGMLELCADARCGVVLMHMQGEPATMQRDPQYRDVVAEVREFLGERAALAQKAGIAREAIAVDPGLGFGKANEHNVALLRGLDQLRALGYPLVVGHSRKSFLARLACRGPEEPPADRLPAGLAVAALAVARGADILRTHDVRATRDAACVADALARGAL
ncbi:MAG TPA: dihydropteroate synthase [Candidatus Thermoplasmatota archaeon]|jgi:dihydropteroate synthase|nr:dihydropteroate synthase [Candidatus Thermoplasmatota archaeon]